MTRQVGGDLATLRSRTPGRAVGRRVDLALSAAAAVQLARANWLVSTANSPRPTSTAERDRTLLRTVGDAMLWRWDMAERAQPKPGESAAAARSAKVADLDHPHGDPGRRP